MHKYIHLKYFLYDFILILLKTYNFIFLQKEKVGYNNADDDCDFEGVAKSKKKTFFGNTTISL